MTISIKALLVPSLLLLLLLGGCGAASSSEDEQDLTTGAGVERAGLRKGTPGARVGDTNYCNNPAAPCAAGEGDCDSNTQCAAGLVCGGQLSQFGVVEGNACVPAHCVNKSRDGDETQIDCGGSCGTVCPTPVCQPNGSHNRCNDDCVCQAGEGDCDSNTQCAAGLVCGGQLSQFGVAEGNACVPAHCVNKSRDGDETQIDCGGSCGTVCPTPVCQPNGNHNRCNSDCVCQAGEGDCDSNTQCAAGLVCGGKLSQFGVAEGNACVAPHCLNRVQDGNETQVDCGGDCGSVCQKPTSCVTSGLYNIAVNSVGVSSWPKSEWEWGNCTTWSSSYQTQLKAVVLTNTVEVEGYGFSGSYPIIGQTPNGFVAQAGGEGFTCGDAYPAEDNSGVVTLTFDCSGHVRFDATCVSDLSQDGCYPNYMETATGRGTRSLSCAKGYVVSAGSCVDIDECLNSPCAPAETCANTPGSFTCS